MTSLSADNFRLELLLLRPGFNRPVRSLFLQAVRSTHGLEVPLSHEGKLLVGPEYIHFLCQLANRKMEENLRRIQRSQADDELLSFCSSSSDLQHGVSVSSSGSTRTSRRLCLRRTSSSEQIHIGRSPRRHRRRPEQQQETSRGQTVCIGGGGDGRKTLGWRMLLVPAMFLSWRPVRICSRESPGDQRRPSTRTKSV